MGAPSVTAAVARLAEHSSKSSHAKFCTELEEARKAGKGRLYRNILSDSSTGWRARFGNIAARTDYQRRRGR